MQKASNSNSWINRIFVSGKESFIKHDRQILSIQFWKVSTCKQQKKARARPKFSHTENGFRRSATDPR